jgi:NAD(P)-dependent dehydrogenase (short-subunit alcohol dehydrogenase family)
MIQIRHKVVITGASRGLGKKIAEKFCFAGADLALIARDTDTLKKMVDELKTDAREDQVIEFFICDLNNLKTMPVLIQKIKNKFGNPDVLVNNAGVQGPIGPLQENDWKEWQKCLNILLLSPVLLCRGFLPAMIKKQYGRIINISGGGATKGRPNFTSYATAKCGLVRFTETLAEEVKDMGIYANCVAPGAMRSEMTSEIITAGIEKAGELEHHNALLLGKDNKSMVNRAADLVLFLASDKSNGITGKLISAVWDPWNELPEHLEDLKNSDVYTLRRIVPKDRDMDWGDV